MKAYLWSRHSEVYHIRQFVTEKCNSDGIRDREESDDPPTGKRTCSHCQRQRAWEASRG